MSDVDWERFTNISSPPATNTTPTAFDDRHDWYGEYRQQRLQTTDQDAGVNIQPDLAVFGSAFPQPQMAPPPRPEYFDLDGVSGQSLHRAQPQAPNRHSSYPSSTAQQFQQFVAPAQVDMSTGRAPIPTANILPSEINHLARPHLAEDLASNLSSATSSQAPTTTSVLHPIRNTIRAQRDENEKYRQEKCAGCRRMFPINGNNDGIVCTRCFNSENKTSSNLNQQITKVVQSQELIRSSMSQQTGNITKKQKRPKKQAAQLPLVPLDLGQSQNSLCHSTPEAARAYTIQPPSEDCEQLNIPGDDWVSVKNEKYVGLCHELQDALRQVPSAAPSDWEQFYQDYHNERYPGHFQTVRQLMENPQQIKMAQAYIMVTISTAVDMHETGLPKVAMKADTVDKSEENGGRGFKPDLTLKCSDRIQKIIDVVKKNAHIKKDLIQGRSIDQLVRNPQGFLDGKMTNVRSNAKKKMDNDRRKRYETGDATEEDMAGGVENATKKGRKTKASVANENENNLAMPLSPSASQDTVATVPTSLSAGLTASKGGPSMSSPLKRVRPDEEVTDEASSTPNPAKRARVGNDSVDNQTGNVMFSHKVNINDPHKRITASKPSPARARAPSLEIDPYLHTYSVQGSAIGANERPAGGYGTGYQATYPSPPPLQGPPGNTFDGPVAANPQQQNGWQARPTNSSLVNGANGQTHGNIGFQRKDRHNFTNNTSRGHTLPASTSLSGSKPTLKRARGDEDTISDALQTTNPAKKAKIDHYGQNVGVVLPQGLSNYGQPNKIDESTMTSAFRRYWQPPAINAPSSLQKVEGAGTLTATFSLGSPGVYHVAERIHAGGGSPGVTDEETVEFNHQRDQVTTTNNGSSIDGQSVDVSAHVGSSGDSHTDVESIDGRKHGTEVEEYGFGTYFEEMGGKTVSDFDFEDGPGFDASDDPGTENSGTNAAGSNEDDACEGAFNRNGD